MTKKSTEKVLVRFAVFFLIVFTLLLSGCTVCPDEQCPVVPNAVPGQ